MKIFIIDASFVLTSFNPDSHVARLRLKSILEEVKENKAQIHAPSLLVYEFANGLRFSYKTPHERALIFDSWISLPVKLFHFENHHLEQILNQSSQTKTTFYDSSYHYLATLLDGVFLTCDQAYFKKAKDLDHMELIK